MDHCWPDVSVLVSIGRFVLKQNIHLLNFVFNVCIIIFNTVDIYTCQNMMDEPMRVRILFMLTCNQSINQNKYL